MTDVFSQAKRSQVMAAIRSHGNRDTELRLIGIFRACHITGWRRNARLPGKPDFVFRKQRVAVFVDGCFWHGCRWHCRMPTSNQNYWAHKIWRNKARDRNVACLLKSLGWRVIHIWAHALKHPKQIEIRVKRLLNAKGLACNHTNKIL
jgi:DNA mismatch endonuclease, patch repair protein